VSEDVELRATRDRIATFYEILVSLRKTEKLSNYLLMSTGYFMEIEKMQKEIKDYLMSAPQSVEAGADHKQCDEERLAQTAKAHP
jgi:hypothetical protein